MPEESLTFALEYDSDDQIPEPVKSLYKQNESGKFVLFAESKAKVNQFRDERTKALKERDEYLKKISDLEPQAAKAKEYEPYYRKLKEIEENQLLESERAAVQAGKLDVSDIVANRTKQMQADFQSKLEQTNKMLEQKDAAIKDYEKRLAETQINQGIHIELTKLGNTARLKPATKEFSPSEFIIDKAREIFRLEDGKIVPRDKEGNIIYAKDGQNPITYAEWVSRLPKAMEFLFEPSEGSGHIGSGLTSGSRSGKGMTFEEAKMNTIALMNRAHQKKK